jgi:hypothetical protein
MHHRLRRLAAVLLAVAAVAAPVMLAPSAKADLKLTIPAAQAMQRVLDLGVQRSFADNNSLNWGGYSVDSPAGGVTQVSGLLITPKPKLLPPFLSASWVGIGGSISDDLIQAGVAFQATPADYYVWYEMLPSGHVPVRSGCVGDPSCSVTFNDRISVDIRNTIGDNWKISIANLGKWTWSLNTHYTSSYSSAEWIYEAAGTSLPLVGGAIPFSLPAANDHVQFFNSSYTQNGAVKSLASADATKSNISPVGGLNLATPSPIRNAGFAVCPYKQSCPAP